MASDAFKQKLLAQARAIHAAALKQNQKKKLQDYIRASSGDATHRQNVANFTKTTDSKVAARNAGQQRAQTRLTKLGEDVSSVITNGEDRRKYTALRAMQSVRSDLAKKAKPITAQAHQRMAQQHADDAEAILDKYRKESSDMCNVCGQTPCNCTSIDEALSSVPGVSGKRVTAVQRAIRRAQKTPQEVAMVNNSFNPYVEDDLIDEAKVPSGLTWTGSELKKRPELVAAAARRKNYQAYLRRKAAKEQSTTKVDESSDKLYAGYQADVLSLKAKAKKQEQERGPVDIQKLAARLRAVKLKGNQK